MWFRINLDGIVFHLRISDYVQSTKGNTDNWCKVDLLLRARKWLNYRITANEILEAFEVERIRDTIDDLLSGNLKNEKRIECTEPDFEFQLYPEDHADVLMDFIISFWDQNGALSANQLVLVFGRRDLEKLLCYFRLVTGVIDTEDETVCELMKNGNLYEED